MRASQNVPVKWAEEHWFSFINYGFFSSSVLYLASNQFLKHSKITFQDEFVFVQIPCFIGAILGKMENRK